MTVDVAGAQPNKESMAETGIKRLKESLSIHVAKHSNFTSDRVKDLVVVCDAAPECPLELWHLCDGRGIKDTVARTQRHSDTDASTDDRSWCCGQWQCNCIPVANGCCFWPLCAHSIAGVSSKHAPQTLCVRRASPCAPRRRLVRMPSLQLPERQD